MINNFTFRTALLVSFSLHMLALAPWHALNFKTSETAEPIIEVTYILETLKPTPVKDEAIKNLPEKYDVKKKDLVEKQPHEAEEQYIEEKELKKLDEYIAYHELVREKIKKRVTRLYKRTAQEGRVDAIFTLSRRGALKSVEIAGLGSKNEKYLIEIAEKSIRAAAPFPPFPEALKKEEPIDWDDHDNTESVFGPIWDAISGCEV